MVGADICGFGWNTTVELCARWQALGAFYPFSRNHNELSASDQDPVALGQVVVNATKNSLQIRYTLLPYLYTVFYENSVSGHPVIRAPFWEHAWDSESESQANHQFLWGSSLMIIPILDEGKTDVRGYFPTRSKWYNYETLTQLKTENEENREYWFKVPLDKITVTLKGKSVIPYHTSTKMTISQQKDLSNFGLLVALSSTGEAKGNLFWDDGETVDTVLTGDYSLIQFNCKSRKLVSTVKRYRFGMKPLTDVKILGVPTVVSTVKINNVNIQTFSYNRDTKVLHVKNLSQNLGVPFALSWN